MRGNYFLDRIINHLATTQLKLFVLFVAVGLEVFFLHISYSGLRYQCEKVYFCSGSWKIYFFPAELQNSIE